MTPTQINLSISPSRYMKAYISVVHALVLVALVVVPLHSLLWLLATLMAVLHWRYCLKRYTSVKYRDGISQLSYREGQWRLVSNDTETPVFLNQATIWRWLVVMNFKSYQRMGQRRGRYALVLWPDSVDDDSFRRLRVHLKHMNVFGRPSPKNQL